MCFGAIGDAFSAVDKVANSINPFKGITDWGTDNTLSKIPGIGKPLGQLADWGDSHPAEVGAGIGAGWAAAAYAGAGAAGGSLGGAAGATAEGSAAGTLGAADSAAASSELGLTAADVGGTSGAVAGTGAATAAGTNTSALASGAGAVAKYAAPAVVSSLLAPKPPKTKAPTAMPDPLAEQQATQQKLIAQMARRGRASTILTNPGSAGGSLGG